MNWTLIVGYLLACYIRGCYVALWKWGVDERNIDAIMWHVKDGPTGSAFYLTLCLFILAPIATIGAVFTLPFWLMGKILAATQRALGREHL